MTDERLALKPERMDPLLIEKYRLETPGIPGRIHFNNAGAALPPLPVIDVLQSFLGEEALLGGYEIAAKYRELIMGVYGALARLLHTESRNIALANNATDAYNRALSAVPFQAGDVILTTANDYVSNIIAFLQLKKQKGIKVVVAPNGPNGAVDVEEMQQLLKKYHPRLVAVTHIPTSSGLIQDVYAIGGLLKDMDALYLVDACQSAGQLDLDVGKMNCDFLSATGRKFLRGPRGTGFLYASGRVLEMDLEPIFLDLHAADWLSHDQYQMKEDARRFELWERNYALVLGLKTAVEYALDIGLPVIEQRVQVLSAYLREGLATIPGIQLMEAGSPLSGIVTIKVDGAWSAEDFHQFLMEHHINTSLIFKEGARYDLPLKNADWVSRISVHYYNTKTEIETLYKVLRTRL